MLSGKVLIQRPLRWITGKSTDHLVLLLAFFFAARLDLAIPKPRAWETQATRRAELGRSFFGKQDHHKSLVC